MPETLFNYVTPLLFPLIPADGGKLVARLNIQRALDSRAAGPFDGRARLDIVRAADGNTETLETEEFEVVDGTVEGTVPWRDYSLDRLGYVEISLTCDQPVFRRIDLQAGYGVMTIPDFGTVTVIPDAKYARPIIIEQIQATGGFCLVHAGCLVDRERGAENSFLLMNPYDKDIVAKLTASTGRSVKRRVRPKAVETVSLSEILDDGAWGCVMVTANNRLPVWDLRHALGAPFRPNSIDHLDVFRGSPTHERVGPWRYVRAMTRRGLRDSGLRIA